MIQHLSRCPYCLGEVGFDWHSMNFVANPDAVRPICEHVVWLVGTIRRGPDSETVSGLMHRGLWSMVDQAEICELLGDIECGAEVSISADFNLDFPTLNNDPHIFEASIAYALAPEFFLAKCREKVCYRSQHRGPVIKWWGQCSAIS